MLLPLGSPLPEDAVSAARGESGMLGSLSVPLKWGTAVPPDDYDHWAPKPEVGDDTGDKVGGARNSAGTDGTSERSDGEAQAEPRFDIPRTGRVIPHSPAAG